MFAGYSDEPFSNRAFNPRLRAACRAIGVGEITAHGLRHSAATILLNHVGKDLREIQELLRQYPHDRALHPRRLRADSPDGGGAQPGFGVKVAKIIQPFGYRLLPDQGIRGDLPRKEQHRSRDPCHPEILGQCDCGKRYLQDRTHAGAVDI